MYDIQLNESGTRHMNVTDQNLETIRKYNLFNGLVSSTGYVTETELEKLKLNIRSLIASSKENTKDLLDLCIDVVYHDKMKAYGLKNLIQTYIDWCEQHPQ
uniref:hypothetical protein n=1 Tax=Alloprevotella sp. TaxID=1872471 RepID=UPI0015ABB9BC